MASIYFILKFQGDLNGDLSNFNQFVTNNLHIARQDLIRQELRLVSIIPPSFFLMMTFSEFLVSCFIQLRVPFPEIYNLTTRATELCLGFYLFEHHPFQFQALAAAGLAEAGADLGFCAGLSPDSVTEYFSSQVPADPTHIGEIRQSFLNENGLVKQLFPEL